MEKEVRLINRKLDRLYSMLENKDLTKNDKISIINSIENLESEINQIMGCWSEDESLYFDNGKKL